MSTLKVVGLSFLLLILITIITVISFNQYSHWKRHQKGSIFFELEATFMQYACGDLNDDMKIKSVSDPQFRFMVERDIDPELEGYTPLYLKEYFYRHRSDTFGMTYRLSGVLSKYPEYGCDSQAPIFWVSTIEKLDGTAKETFNE